MALKGSQKEAIILGIPKTNRHPYCPRSWFGMHSSPPTFVRLSQCHGQVQSWPTLRLSAPGRRVSFLSLIFVWLLRKWPCLPAPSNDVRTAALDIGKSPASSKKPLWVSTSPFWPLTGESPYGKVMFFCFAFLRSPEQYQASGKDPSSILGSSQPSGSLAF